MPVFQLTDKLIFPPVELAEPNGLLAVGGDLSPDRILLAYRNGIFPWYSEGDPLLWWCPAPRLVIFPAEFRIPKRLARQLRQRVFTVTRDRNFTQVITACAETKRRKEDSTWITGDMIKAYCRLHELGYAHSIECWFDDELVGGLYGISLGGIFFGESMFSREPSSSKVALVYLVELLRKWNFALLDCQMKTAHLMQFGAREISGTEFQEILRRNLSGPFSGGKWEHE